MKLYNKIFGNKGNLTEQDIEKYLSGNANAKEQHSIEAKSLQNQLFADAIDGYAKNKNFDISKLKNRTSKKLFKNNGVNYLIAIAAMFAFVTILFFIPLDNKNDELAEIPTTKSPVKGEIAKEETIETKKIEINDEIIESKDEIITTLQEQSEKKEAEKLDKSGGEQIIVTGENKDLIADNSRTKRKKKSAEKPVVSSKTAQPEIGELVVGEAEEVDKDESISQGYSASKSKVANNDYFDSVVSAGIEEETISNEIKAEKTTKTFIDNFPTMYLADNSIKVANYSGTRLVKDEVKLDDARSLGTSAKYANKKVAEAEKQADSEFMFEEEYFYNDFLDKGLFKFKKEKYAEAIRVFDVILKQYPDDINAKFYKALSFYKLEKYRKAIKYFDFVINDKINIFDQEAEWSKALCLLETNRSEGKKLLQKIVDDAGFYSQKAMILLGE